MPLLPISGVGETRQFDGQKAAAKQGQVHQTANTNLAREASPVQTNRLSRRTRSGELRAGPPNPFKKAVTRQTHPSVRASSTAKIVDCYYSMEMKVQNHQHTMRLQPQVVQRMRHPTASHFMPMPCPPIISISDRSWCSRSTLSSLN
jgi:hypothetical protein